MIFDLFRALVSGESYDIGTALLRVAAVVFVLFMTMPVHEAAHAWMAKKLGDDTGWMHGRLTLNPLKHIDWMGALLLLVVGFGYAKPVPVNVRNFKKPKRDMALTALAGPVSNILMAMICLFFANSFLLAYTRSGSEVLELIVTFFATAASINITLGVFNLIPIPPLDGSRLLTALLPNKAWYAIMRYETYIRYGLFALLLLGVLNKPITFMTELTFNGLNYIVSLPFRLLV